MFVRPMLTITLAFALVAPLAAAAAVPSDTPPKVKTFIASLGSPAAGTEVDFSEGGEIERLKKQKAAIEISFDLELAPLHEQLEAKMKVAANRGCLGAQYPSSCAGIRNDLMSLAGKLVDAQIRQNDQIVLVQGQLLKAFEDELINQKSEQPIVGDDDLDAECEADDEACKSINDLGILIGTGSTASTVRQERHRLRQFEKTAPKLRALRGRLIGETTSRGLRLDLDLLKKLLPGRPTNPSATTTPANPYLLR